MGVDPYLQDTPFTIRVRLLTGFVARVRSGYYGQGKSVQEAGSRVYLVQLGGAMIKSQKIFYCPIWLFFTWDFDKMDPKFQKKNNQKCPVGGADDYCTGFC